jgi:hypothetical protein
MARLGWTVRLMFWVGIVVDAVAAVALLAPADSPIRQLAYPGVLGSQAAYSDGTRTAFPLMLGWTLLLVWGLQKPIERRMILPQRCRCWWGSWWWSSLMSASATPRPPALS